MDAEKIVDPAAVREVQDAVLEQTEEWRPVVGWEGFYELSNLGLVRSVARIGIWSNGHWRRLPSRILKQKRTNRNYCSILLQHVGRKDHALVHRLVLEAFVGLRPKGMQACHFPDRNPSNNRVSNLRWDTGSGNMADSLIHGTRLMGEKHHRSQLTDNDVVEIRRMYVPHGKTGRQFLADMFCVSVNTIKLIVNRKTWKHLT